MRVLIPIDGGADCREAIRFVNSRKDWLESEKPQIELLYVQRPYIEHPHQQYRNNQARNRLEQQ